MRSSEARQILDENSPLALFPDFLGQALKHATRGDAPAGQVLREMGSPIKDLIIPLNGDLKTFVPTGRPSETKMLRKYSPGSLVGLWDMFYRDVYGSTIVSDRPANVLYIKGPIFKAWVKENPESFALLAFLNVTPAVLEFALECLQKGAPPQNVVSMLSHIDKKGKVINRHSPILDLKEIFFIESGSGFARVFEDDQPLTDVLLHGGVYIGNGLMRANHKYKIQIFPSVDLRVHSIPLGEAASVLGSGVADNLRFERWMEGKQDEVKKVQKSGAGLMVSKMPIEVLHDYFEGIDLTGVKLTKNAGPEAALMSLINISLLRGSSFSEVHAQIEIAVSQQLSLGRLGEILERQGLLTRCFRSSYEGLALQAFPLLVFFRQRPVVLIAADEEEVILLDPMKGLLRLDPDTFEDDWTQQALEVLVSPIEHQIDDAVEKNYLRDTHLITEHAFSEMLGDKRAYGNIFKIGLVCVAFQELLPQFFQYTLDKVLNEKNFSAMPTLATGFFGVVIAAAIAKAMKSYFGEIKMNEQNFSSSSVLLRQLMQFPSHLVGASRAGEYNSRWQVVEGVIHSWNEVMSTTRVVITLALTTLVIIFVYNWQVGLLSLIMGAVHLWLRGHYMGERLHKLTGVAEVRQKGYDDFIEQLSNVAQVRARNSQGKIADRIEESTLEMNKIQRRSMNEMIKGAGLGSIIAALTMGISIGMEIYMLQNHTITGGTFVALATYVGMFWATVKQWGGVTEQNAFLNYETKALMPFVRTDVEYTKLYSHNVKSYELHGKIRFDHVGFRYHGTNGFGLQDLNFTILPGQTVAIVGQNGSGKTTVGKILAGLVKPQAGTIFYDDINSRHISSFSLRDQIGYISHKPVVFEGTILANIAFGDDSPDLERAKDAAMRAGAHEFIEKLPAGYDFYVNGPESSFSLGEQMLLQIARALYRNPKILVIDDANVSIDARAARVFANNLHTLMRDRTVILISHRISNLRQADQIIVLKKGTVAEIGTHDELMARNREYMQLFKAQVNAY